jgi:hypothetical protein
MPFIGNKPSAVPLTSADITDSIITSAKIVDGTIVNDDINASAAIVATKLTGITSPAGFRNRIINGDMQIDQRNAGASSTANGYTVDRFEYFSTQATKATWQQNAGAVTPPTDFINYLGFTSSSSYSILSTDQFLVSQKIEGLNVYDLNWGTANAKTVTLSFYVRSSLTGTFGGAFQNSSANRNYPFSYSISTSNTWEKKTITIAGDTSGTWLKTNGKGIVVVFSLGTGATYSATAGAWTASSFITSATGATSVVGTNGATFYITGVQLEAGTSATDFEFLPIDVNLERCLRYYETGYVYHPELGSLVTQGGGRYSYNTPKRTGATLVFTNTIGYNPTYNTRVSSINGFGWFTTNASPYYTEASFTASSEL